ATLAEVARHVPQRPQASHYQDDALDVSRRAPAGDPGPLAPPRRDRLREHHHRLLERARDDGVAHHRLALEPARDALAQELLDGGLRELHARAGPGAAGVDDADVMEAAGGILDVPPQTVVVADPGHARGEGRRRHVHL